MQKLHDLGIAHRDISLDARVCERSRWTSQQGVVNQRHLKCECDGIQPWDIMGYVSVPTWCGFVQNGWDFLRFTAQLQFKQWQKIFELENDDKSLHFSLPQFCLKLNAQPAKFFPFELAARHNACKTGKASMWYRFCVTKIKKIYLLRVIPTMTFQNSLLTPLLSEAFVTGLLPN